MRVRTETDLHEQDAADLRARQQTLSAEIRPPPPPSPEAKEPACCRCIPGWLTRLAARRRCDFYLLCSSLTSFHLSKRAQTASDAMCVSIGARARSLSACLILSGGRRLERKSSRAEPRQVARRGNSRGTSRRRRRRRWRRRDESGMGKARLVALRLTWFEFHLSPTSVAAR